MGWNERWHTIPTDIKHYFKMFYLIYPEAGRKSLWLYSLQSLQTSVKGRFQWSDRHHHRCALTLLAGGWRKSNASPERFETTVIITTMMLFEVSEHTCTHSGSFLVIKSTVLRKVYKSLISIPSHPVKTMTLHIKTLRVHDINVSHFCTILKFPLLCQWFELVHTFMLMHKNQISVTWKYLKAVQAKLNFGVLVSQCIFHERLREKPQRTESIDSCCVSFF